MSSTSATAAAATTSAFVERDFSLVDDLLADDVVFHSPVLARPWRTKPVVARLGPAMVSIFDAVEFAPAVTDGPRAILSFSGRLQSLQVGAIETLEIGADGRIAEMAIYIRPLSGLIAVAKAMEARVDPGLLAEHGR